MKSALLVVDVQNDFCKPRGALFSERVANVVPAIKREVEKARKRKMKVVFTQDWHAKNDREFKVWPEHCVRNTWGAEIIDELKPKEGELVVKKRGYSAFYRTRLHKKLKEQGINTIVLTGCVTSICVFFSAFDAFRLGYNIVVKKSAVADVSEETHKFALRHMKLAFRARVE